MIYHHSRNNKGQIPREESIAKGTDSAKLGIGIDLWIVTISLMVRRDRDLVLVDVEAAELVVLPFSGDVEGATDELVEQSPHHCCCGFEDRRLTRSKWTQFDSILRWEKKNICLYAPSTFKQWWGLWWNDRMVVVGGEALGDRLVAEMVRLWVWRRWLWRDSHLMGVWEKNKAEVGNRVPMLCIFLNLV